MIRSFRSKEAKALFDGRSIKRFQRIRRIIQRKMMQLHAAHHLGDVRIFPGNRLEPLRGDRKGQHSIRINDQYRICFVWRDGDAYDVEVVDYH